jgi:hypothetical protein
MAVSPTNAPFYMPSPAGSIAQQNQNLTNPNETPEDAVRRLNTEGLAIDQIAQVTGVPPDQVAMIINTGDPQYLSQITTPPQRPSFEGIGIDSILPDTDTQELSEFVDQGNSMTDFVKSQLGVEGGLQGYLLEDEMVEALANVGVDRDEADAESLDGEPISNKTRTQAVEEASLAGGAALGTGDPDAVQTITTTSQIQQSFDPYDPDDVKAKLGVYRTAAESFFGTDDLEKFIPQPDKALPFLVAGAALINAGHHGHSWGEALSTSFLNYATTKRKEEKDYEKSILGLKLKDRQDIRTFATQLYLADRQDQIALERALLTKEKKPYKVNENLNPVYYTTHQAGIEAERGNRVIPWDATHGDQKEYTIFADVNKDGQPDANAPARTQLMTPFAAQDMQAEGAIVREGNLTKGKKLYMLDGVPAMQTEEELEAFMKEFPESAGNVRVIGPSSAKAVRNRATGKLTWVDNRELLTPRGRETWSPIGEESMVVFGPDGQPLLLKGDAAGLGTFLTQTQRGTEEKRVRDFLIQTDQKRNNVLTTHATIKKLLEDQRAAGKDIAFGLAGNITTLGKNVIDQVDQLEKLFTAKDSGYTFYTDANNDGKRNPGETATNFSGFSQQFEESIGNTNLGRFLQGSGLGKKRLTNMVLTLALQSAANDEQKGRDISDKDIERFLARAGARATSEEEFSIVLDDLALGAIRKHESLIDSEIRYAARLKLDPESDEPMTMIDFMYPNLIEDQYTDKPYRDADLTIGELKEQLIESTSALDSTDYKKSVVLPQEVGPGGNNPAGYGTLTNHQIYEEFVSRGRPDEQITPEQMAYIAKVKGFFDLENPKEKAAWQVIKNYVETMRRQGIREP